MKNRVAVVLLGLLGLVAVGASSASAARPIVSQVGLANRCVTFKPALPLAGPVYLKPTALDRRYMLYGGPGRLLASDNGKSVLTAQPGPNAEWSIRPDQSKAYFQAHKAFSVFPIESPGNGYSAQIRPAKGCVKYPEASVGASGPTFKGTRKDGTVKGFVDSHLHITASLRAGGQVISGENYNRFGITKALGRDADVHGSDGSKDITGNLLRIGFPAGKHDTAGWPGFTGWPTNNTNTHQQVYYVWLKRAWEAGMRLTVAQTVEDQPICEIEPVTSHSCDETATVKLEIRKLKGLQNYVDAQAGGKGRGFFRLVYSPKQARKVIEKGRLAVLIGIESSNPFGCSEKNGVPACTKKKIDRSIADLHKAGVRDMFLAHWVNNALAGPSPEGGIKGAFINVFNKFQTGSYLTVENCPDPAEGEVVESLSQTEINVLSNYFPKTAYLKDEPLPEYPDTAQCNTEGLTSLGAYAVRQLMKNHMLIELDHLSEKARAAVLKIGVEHRYPLVSGHTGTGGAWSASKLKTLYRLGGFASATPDQAPGLTDKLLSFDQYRTKNHYFGVGLGTDTGGFSSLPGPAADAATNPLPYPFKSYDGKVTFQREQTGDRTFDFNTDGVAQYGLFADLLANVERQPKGKQAMASLFRSAEAYLQTWQLAYERK